MSFTVRIKPFRVALMLVGLILPMVMFIWFYRFIKLLGRHASVGYAFLVEFMMIAMFLLLLYFFIERVGKKLEVYGRSIIITRYFFMVDNISLSDITECTVTYGITVHNKNHTSTYNQIDIYYNGGKKISFADNMFDEWKSLVDYMSWNVKVTAKDGRSRFYKYLDEKTDNTDIDNMIREIEYRQYNYRQNM